LLVAQTNSIPDSGTQEEEFEEGDEEKDFYFDDGTYVAIRTGSQNNASSSGAQEHYYESLVEDFLSLRAVLRRTPPLAAIQALGESRPITLPPNSKVARDAWERHIAHCDPHPVQLASIDTESLLEILKLVGKKLRRLLQTGSAKTTSRVGLWAWSLLARCPDRGELVSEEISDVRALATKAAELLVAHDKPGISPADESAEDGTEQDGLDLAVREALMAKVQMLGNGVVSHGDEANDGPLASSKAILDIIITIVGEAYGQRDLLDHREVWTSEQEAFTGSVHHQPGG
jgi:regulator of vacuolar morphogenesis